MGLLCDVVKDEFVNLVFFILDIECKVMVEMCFDSFLIENFGVVLGGSLIFWIDKLLLESG